MALLFVPCCVEAMDGSKSKHRGQEVGIMRVFYTGRLATHRLCVMLGGSAS